jgi:glycosyltransferase involved in cell wall biosynthesis
LKRNSEIIYPPVETSKYYYKKSKGYWLSVNRLINQKRVDMQIKAFKMLSDEKLIIVGSYEQSEHFKEYADYIKKIKPENVEIKSWINWMEIIDLYSNCKGFITTMKDEDFGLTPIEAMASGKPVIAPNEGGYKETIINGKTGILIDDINEYKLIEAINKLGKEIDKNPLKFKKACQEQAKKFDTKIFINKIKEQLKTNEKD